MIVVLPVSALWTIIVLKKWSTAFLGLFLRHYSDDQASVPPGTHHESGYQARGTIAVSFLDQSSVNFQPYNILR